MTRELFEDFMEWSWKYIEWCLNNKNNDHTNKGYHYKDVFIKLLLM